MSPRHALLALPLLAFVSACDSADPEDAARVVEPEIVFEGTEVQAALAEDPDTVFFVDLRDGNIVYLDQREAAIDFSNFIVQCPTMAGPVPMDFFIETMLSEDFRDHDYTVMKSTITPEDTFRVVTATFPEDQPDLQCVIDCSEPSDCVWLCH